MNFNSGGVDNPFEGRTEEVPEDPFEGVEDVDLDEPLQGQESEETNSGSFKDLVVPGEIEYLPVLDPIMLIPRIKELEGRGSAKIGGKRIGWWQEDAMLTQHPYMLANPTMMASKKHDSIDNFRDTFMFPRGETFVLMDSGGLQISLYENADLVWDEELHSWDDGRLHPGRVVEWQAKYGDVGAIIDFGTWVRGEERHTQTYDEWYEEKYEPNLELTKKTSRMAQEYAEDLDTEFELLGVLHGRPAPSRSDPFESYKRWLTETTEYDEFYGWAFGSSADNIAQLAMAMMLTDELKNPDYMHIFGVAMIEAAAVTNYLAGLTDTFVTVDSTKHTVGSRFRQFMMPYLQDSMILSTQEAETQEESIDIDRMPCRCEACHCIAEEEGHTFLTKGEGTRRAMAMQLHNLAQILQERQAILGIMNNYDIEEIFDGLTIQGSGRDLSIKRSDIKFWDVMRKLKGERSAIQLYYTLELVRECHETSTKEAMRQYQIPDVHTEDAKFSIRPRESRGATMGW